MDAEGRVTPEGKDTFVVDVHVRRSSVKKGPGPVQGVREDVVTVGGGVRRVDVGVFVSPLPP